MMKERIVAGIALVSLVLGMTPVSAKTKVPSIAKKTTVWVDTVSSKKYKEAYSFGVSIKNMTKKTKLSGSNVKYNGAYYTIASTNKNFRGIYTPGLSSAPHVTIEATGKVTNSLVGQKGNLSFDVVVGGKTYHLKTSFVCKKNPGHIKYIKVNGKNITSTFKEDYDFETTMNLANKKVKLSYKVNAPNKDHGVEVLKANGSRIKFKNNMTVKKGDTISISVLAPGWEKDGSYNIKVK